MGRDRRPCFDPTRMRSRVKHGKAGTQAAIAFPCFDPTRMRSRVKHGKAGPELAGRKLVAFFTIPGQTVKILSFHL